jgi:hypothetical protein
MVRYPWPGLEDWMTFSLSDPFFIGIKEGRIRKIINPGSSGRDQQQMMTLQDFHPQGTTSVHYQRFWDLLQGG